MPVVRRRLIASALAALALPATSGAHAQVVEAPNFVRIDARLATSGQPDRQALAALGGQGFEAVVYLAPSSVPNAVREEPEMLAAQGIEFVQIPIPFAAPEEAHLDALSKALERLQDRRVLVHCEINMRASTLVFLYRVIHRQEAPAGAYEAVARVWSPRGVWRRLIVEQLAKHRIAFEPY